MQTTKNIRVRNEAKAAGVKLWQIAEALGMTDSNFSRKLRKELPEAETQEILSIIQRIAEREC